MSGGSGGGGSTMQYVTGGLQTAIGGVASVFGAPEIGVPLMMSGVSQLSSGASGGGGGGGGGLGGGMMNMSAPGTGGAPGLGQIGQALGNNPSLSGINPSQVTGVSGQAPAAGPSMMSQLGQTGSSIAPALQSLMNAGGLNPMQKPQQSTTPPPPPAPPGQGAGGGGMQPLTMPQASTPPTAAGVTAAGAGNNQALAQIRAMMGLGPY